MNERLAKLRRLMEERHMDAYLIPTSDFHESEYVGEYFKCRRFITGVYRLRRHGCGDG